MTSAPSIAARTARLSRRGDVASFIAMDVMREANRAIREGLATDASTPVANSKNYVFRQFGSELAEVRRQSQLTQGTLQNLHTLASRAGTAFAGLRTGASGVSAALAGIQASRAVGALTAVAGAARTATAAVGASAMGGLRVAASGLTAALGGPWGIALAAAGVALASFAMHAATTRQKVETLKSTFDDFGNATSSTVDQIANDLNTMKVEWWDQDIRTWFQDGPDTVGESLKALGLNSRDTAKMLVEDKDAYLDLGNALADLGKGFRPSEEALARVAELTGLSTDEIRRMAPHLGETGRAMLTMAENVDGAGAAFENLNGKVVPVSQSSQDLARAFETMGDGAADARDRVSALNEILSKFNDTDVSAEDLFAGMHEDARNAAEAIAQLHLNMQDLAPIIDDQTGAFDRNSDAGNDLYNELKRVTDASKAAALESDDVVGTLKSGKQAFLDAAAASGVQGQALEDLALAYDHVAQGTPDEIAKTITIKGLDAIKDAEAMSRALVDDWDGEEFEAWLRLDSTQAKIEGKDAHEIARMFADDTYMGKLGIDAEDAFAAMEEVESRGMEWDASEYQAWLDANPEKAKLAALDARAGARLFADDKYRALLDADGELALGMIDILKARGDAFSQERFEAWLGMNTEEFLREGLSVDEILARWDNEPHEVRVGLDDQELKGKIATLDRELTLFNKDYTAVLTADDENFMAVMQRAEQMGAEISEPERFKAWIGANSEEFDAKKLTIDEILQLWASEPNEVKIGADGSDANLKIDNLEERLKQLEENPTKVPVEVEDKTDEGVNAAKGRLRDNWENLPSYADLEARENVTPGLNIGMGALRVSWIDRVFESILGARDDTGTGRASAEGSLAGSWVGRLFSSFLGADDHTATGRAAAEGSMGASWVGRLFEALLGGADSTAPAVVAASMALAGSWAGRRFDALLSATNAVGPAVAMALGQLAGFAGRSFAAILDALPALFQAKLAGAIASGVGFAARTFRAVLDAAPQLFQSKVASVIAAGVSFAARTFRSTFDGNPGPFQGNHGTVMSMGFGFAGQVFTAAFDATTGGVSAALTTALSIGASWASQVFTAVFNAVTPNANGGVWPGVRPFANGGFSGPGVRAFASGGFYAQIAKILSSNGSRKENHIAQIASAKTPFRVWAEPETFGESYIPLSPAKRARSTRIWEETGNRLGVNWQAYADGGVTGGARSASSRSVNGSARPVTVNVTNHYPVAEPTSVTTNRALQLAANMI